MYYKIQSCKCTKDILNLSSNSYFFSELDTLLILKFLILWYGAYGVDITFCEKCNTARIIGELNPPNEVSPKLAVPINYTFIKLKLVSIKKRINPQIKLTNAKSN